MRPLTATELRGTWGTLLLPLKDDESIDFRRLSLQVDALIRFQVDGIYTNGTAGEFYNQSEEEFDRISQLLSEACHEAGMPFQIGVSHTSPLISRERLRRAMKLRPGAVQLILPDWSPPSNAEILAFLQTMAEEADGIGLVLYHPPHAKRSLSPADFAAIKKAVPAVIGIKVLGGDAAWFDAMKQNAPGVAIFVAGHLLGDQLQLGAHGSYSNVACLHPGGAQKWYRSMLVDAYAALELGARLQTFMTEYMVPYLTQGYSNQAVDKLLACIGAWTEISIRLRWPYESIPDSEAERLRPLARELLPEFFV